MASDHLHAGPGGRPSGRFIDDSRNSSSKNDVERNVLGLKFGDRQLGELYLDLVTSRRRYEALTAFRLRGRLRSRSAFADAIATIRLDFL